MLEVVIAISVFLVVSVGLAGASVRLASQAARNEVRISTVDAVDSRLEMLSGAPFDQLVSDTYLAPDACGLAGTPQGRQSCVNIGGRSMQIDYRTSVGDDLVAGEGVSGSYVEITASAALPDGAIITRSRQVPTPSAGYTADGAVVRVRAANPSADLPPLTLLDADGDVVAEGVPFSSGTAVVRVDGTACVGSKAPCKVALSADPQSWYRSGDWTLAPSSANGTGGEVTLTAGTLTETLVDVTRVGSAKVRVLAQPTGRQPVAGAPEGSVCVWAVFEDGSGTRQVPYCNTGAGSNNGEFIVLDSWPSGDGASAYPFPSGASVRVTVGAPGSPCPVSPLWTGGSIQAAVAGNALVASDACTSFTWGYPTLGGLATNNPAPLPSGELTVTTGVDAPVYNLIWAARDASGNPAGLPAAGEGNVPAWSKPRAGDFSGPCASDGNPATPCTAPAYAPVPEQSVGAPGGCVTDPYCLSAWNLAPVLTNPAGPHTFSTPDLVENLITFTATDPDGGAVFLRIDTLPTGGTLTDRQGVAVAAGSTLAAGNSWDLRYVCATCSAAVGTMDITLLDAAGGSRGYQVGFYGTAQPWSVTGPSSLSLAQAQSPTPVRVQLTDTTGAVVAGSTPQVTAPGLAASAVTPSDAQGYSTFTLAAGTAAPGVYTATVNFSGRTLVIPVTVTATVGSVAVTSATGGTQGSAGSVAVTVRDVNNTPIAGRAVDLAVTFSGVPTTKVRPEQGVCVSGVLGSCSTVLRVDSSAPAGSYQVNATSGSASASATVTVTSAVASVSAAGARAGGDRYAASTTTAGPVRWFRLDENSGTSASSASGGGAGTWYGGPALGVTPLVAGGASAAATTDGVDDRMCAVGIDLNDDVTFEVWARFSGLTNTSSVPATVFGNPAGGGELQLVLGGSGPGGQEQPGTLRLLAGDGNSQSVVNGTVPNPGTNPDGSPAAPLFSPVPLVPGRLYHLAGVVDGAANQVRLYIDGELVDSRDAPGSFAGDTTWCLGGAAGGPHVAGTFDEAAIYDQALSGPQIAARYALGSTTAAGGGWVTAAQGTSFEVPIKVRDGAGGPVAGQAVTVSSDREGVTVSTPTVTTGVTGEATATLAVAGDAATSLGTGRVLVTVGSIIVPVLVEVSAVPDSIEVAPVSVAAGGRSRWQVTVRDSAGAGVPGWSVSAVGEDAPEGLRLSGRATTDDNGVAVFQVGARPGTAAGVTTVDFTAGGVTASAGVTVTAAGTRIEPLDGPARVVQGRSGEFRLLVRDADGVPLPGATVTVGCSGCGLSFSSPGTDGSGVATVSVVDSGGWNPAGSYPVVVSVNGEPRMLEVAVRGRIGSVSADGPVTVAPGSESTVSVSALSEPLTVGTGATAAIDAGFEAAAVGGQLTDFANSGFWRVQGTGAEDRITASQDQAVTGSQSAHVSGSHPTINRALVANLACATPSAGPCSSPLPTKSYTSAYLYVPAPASGGNPPIVMQLTNTNFNILGAVQYNSDRTGLQLYRFGNVSVGNVPWVTDQWMRLDYEYDSTNSTQRLRLFWGDSLHDRNPASANSDTGAVAAGGGPNSALPAYLYIGSWANRPATNYYLDDVMMYTQEPFTLSDTEPVAGVTVSGSGPSGITVRGAVTGANGVANLAVRVPANVTPGTYPVTLTSGGADVGYLDVVVAP